MTPTRQQWKVYELCHPDHRDMSIADAAKEMGEPSWVVHILLSALKGDHPDLFGNINGDKYCPGGLTVVNKNRHTGKPKIVRYRSDDEGRVRQKF